MNKIYCFDIDNTICLTNGNDYGNSKPIKKRIDLINKLYYQGNTILIDTARGSVTKIDWYDMTKKQLCEWDVKYHLLRVGVKLNADFYIDDKGINDKFFFKKHKQSLIQNQSG